MYQICLYRIEKYISWTNLMLHMVHHWYSMSSLIEQTPFLRDHWTHPFDHTHCFLWVLIIGNLLTFKLNPHYHFLEDLQNWITLHFNFSLFQDLVLNCINSQVLSRFSTLVIIYLGFLNWDYWVIILSLLVPSLVENLINYNC